MTRNAQAVFGAVRFAEERELDVATIAVRTRLSWQQVSAATRDLCKLGALKKRRIRPSNGGVSSVVFSFPHK